MNIALIGSGGREHALCHKLNQSKKTDKIFCIPGNAGTSKIAINLDINFLDFKNLLKNIKYYNIDLVIIGPEEPLVNGVVDFLKKNKVKVFGPNKFASRLEGSKAFMKSLCKKFRIPTANFKICKRETDVKNFLKYNKMPVVVKADGLAAGKGVLIIANPNEAKNEIHEMLINSKFGEASKSVVVEEFLDGIELSCFVITDGQDYKLLPSAKDYKRIGEGDTGLNTGGMGAVSPPTFLTKEFTEKVEKQVIQPTIEGLKKDNINYQGFIFFGLIKVKDDPYVIEYNVRMGDPESEVVLPRIKSDLLELLYVAGNRNLKDHKIIIDDKKTATVFLVSGGYPEEYEKNKEIFGLDSVIDSLVFHAGAKYEDGKVKTNGGRVIAITSIGNSVEEALEKSYKSIKKINFEKMNYRKDIGFDL